MLRTWFGPKLVRNPEFRTNLGQKFGLDRMLTTALTRTREGASVILDDGLFRQIVGDIATYPQAEWRGYYAALRSPDRCRALPRRWQRTSPILRTRPSIRRENQGSPRVTSGAAPRAARKHTQISMALRNMAAAKDLPGCTPEDDRKQTEARPKGS